MLLLENVLSQMTNELIWKVKPGLIDYWGPLSLTLINFNPSVDEYSYAQ